jgi:hypothetical protein
LLSVSSALFFNLNPTKSIDLKITQKTVVNNKKLNPLRAIPLISTPLQKKLEKWNIYKFY